MNNFSSQKQIAVTSISYIDLVSKQQYLIGFGFLGLIAEALLRPAEIFWQPVCWGSVVSAGLLGYLESTAVHRFWH